MPRVVPERLLAALRRPPAVPLEVPGDLAREARRRVRVAALLGFGGYSLLLVVEWMRVMGGTSLERSIDITSDVTGVVLCAALFGAAALSALSDRTVLALALVVEFALACTISVAAPWAGFIRTGHLAALTWVVPIMILFALLVPMTPAASTTVSALCALTLPVGLWLLDARGLVAARSSDYWHSWITGFIAFGIATIAARTAYNARVEVAAARTVGSYSLDERLGQGGMGEVWKARHLLLARPAAIKLILPETLQGASEKRDHMVGRFTREARITASLCSPHTVELFDFGITGDGTLYYAMELLGGLNLEHFVYQFGPIGPGRAVYWLRQACHSLAEAHACGLVHRDIKPANLVVCQYGRDADFIKLLDFGLVRPAATIGDAALTSPGARMGTPGYMAPEQVFGMKADARTDLYALGCVAFWLLAGSRPFEAESAGEVLRQHAQVDPPPLSGRAPHPIPPRLEAVIMSCMAKDPTRRPASAEELDARLEEALDGDRWSPEAARDWWRENLPPESRPETESPVRSDARS